MAYESLRQAVADSRATKKVVILDCCFSGRALADLAGGEETIVGQVGIEGSYILTATPANAVASAPPGERYTAFTGALLDLLNTGITGAQELLTFAEIYPRLKSALTSRQRPEPRQQGSDTITDLALTRNRAYALSPRPDAAHFKLIVQHIAEGNLVPFVGSSDVELAADLAGQFGGKRFGVEPPQLELSEIAQAVYRFRGGPTFYRALRQILTTNREPAPVHRFLARLPRTLEELGVENRYQLIVSTSFDRTLEQAFDDEQEPYDLAVYMASGEDKGKFIHFPYGDTPRPIAQPISYGMFPIADWGEIERTVIVKTRGAVDGNIGGYRWKDNYVITDDHYIDYLSRTPIENLVPVQVLDKLSESHCLFLGYPAHDLNLRVFLTRIRRGESFGAESWAIAPSSPSLIEKQFWAQFNADLYAADLAGICRSTARAAET